MLRGMIGNDLFWQGIQNYYAKYQDLNATTADFRREMEEASGMNLEAFFDQWLYKPGNLMIDGNWTYNFNEKKLEINLNQVQKNTGIITMPIQVAIYQAGSIKPVMKILKLEKEKNSFSIPLADNPNNVVLDPEFWVLMDADFKKKK